MLDEQKFQQFFASFTRSGSGSNITELYSIMPYLTAAEVLIVQDALYYAKKWDIPELETWVLNVIMMRKSNRSLGMFPSMKSFLKSMTLEEQFRGHKMMTGQGNEPS
jgi:hypothetical protein